MKTIQPPSGMVLTEKIWFIPGTYLRVILPENETSKFWAIEGHGIHRKYTGIRIAANQDQDILPYKELHKENLESHLRPHDHEIHQNDISNNRAGIQTAPCDRTVIQDNSFSMNLAGDIKS